LDFKVAVFYQLGVGALSKCCIYLLRVHDSLTVLQSYSYSKFASRDYWFAL